MTSALIMKNSAQEHLLYIQEKVNPILEALVTAVLLERPEDPSFFMLKWLCEQTKSIDGGSSGSGTASSEEIENIRAEINRLKARKDELLALKGGASTGEAEAKPAKSDAEGESEEEDDDDDAPDVMPEPPKMTRGPRQSVSAEAYGQWNKKGDFTAPVYPKTDEQMSRIKACMGSSFLFSSLEEEEMKTVILACQEKKCVAGVKLINQGEDGDSMFIIEEGVVECFKTIDGAEKLVKTCSSGDAFGELALLYNCPRAASVVSKDNAVLWELDRETFNRIVKDSAAKKRTTYTDFLKKIPLFANIDDYEMMTIADALKVETYNSKDTQIIKQRDSGDKFFIVLEGECVAMKEFTPGSEPRAVMTHKDGDYFGELAIIKNEPRAASVFTKSDKVKVLTMERKTFKRLLGPIEEILKREAKRYE